MLTRGVELRSGSHSFMEPRPVKRPPPSVEAVRENERATKRRPATSGACFYSLTIQNSVIHSVKKEILPLDSFISAHTGSDLTETPSSASSLQPWPIDRNKFTQPTHVVWIGKTELSQDHKLLQLSPSTSVVGREFDVGETEIDCSMVMDQVIPRPHFRFFAYLTSVFPALCTLIILHWTTPSADFFE
jgi:hypothetical protein